MSNEVIVFYDIPSKAPGSAWSPNTWRIRYALNYKALPYKTVWVEYPDIADVCKAIGAEPTMIRKNGTPYYTLPVIQDPKTGAVISDSAHIAHYLDSTYPDTPKLIPQGTHTLQKTFRIEYDRCTDPLTPYIIPAVVEILRPKSEEYFVRTREAIFGKKIADMVPTGEAHEVAWKAVETGFGKLNGWMREDDPFVMGDVLSFADFVVAGDLQWCRKAFGEEDVKWKEMMVWHGGRWSKLLKNLEKYEGLVEEVSE
ncbi:glutathione S-transferase [Mycena sp. CBHHK59/15]|nr:glutathione S-transferase [Mycena sp. CBHHK59/15]